MRHDGRVGKRTRSYAARAVVVAATLALAAGCGDYSPQSPPTGIDELTVPTPSVDAGDFVTGIDNPWLDLAPGRSWAFTVQGAAGGTLRLSVDTGTHDVDGVATTALRRTEPGGAVSVDYFAEDRLGNVWWFGREGVWLAGQDGAEAGLAMPATPRLGDGWRTAYAPGVVEQQATVAAVRELVTTPSGDYPDVVAIDLDDPVQPDLSRRVFYASGVGPVMEVSTEGPIYLAELSEVSAGP